MVDLPPPILPQAAVTGLLINLDWVSSTEAYCDCPGKAQHTTKDGKKDCKLYLDPVPTLKCFHDGCKEAITEATKQLRHLWRGQHDAPSSPKRLTSEDKARMEAVRRREALRRRTKNSAAKLLAENKWAYSDICKDSPTPIPSQLPKHWELLLDLFEDDDVVWIGGVCDSGKPHHSRHFRTKREWLDGNYVSGQFTCPSTFRPGSHSRSIESLAIRRFLVVESDTLSKDAIGGVFRWMDKKAGINLRAIVDTAGKSLHGWFEYPNADGLESLKVMLPELGCDAKMFNASQPCRLPGALRDGKFQQLIYLKQQ